MSILERAELLRFPVQHGSETVFNVLGLKSFLGRLNLALANGWFKH